MRKEAYFAGGCFWGLEAKFQCVPGVLETQVGYSGGTTKEPTYRQVCQDTTGHAETVKVVFETDEISMQQLLELFFSYHDPPNCCSQGLDCGSQYRSMVFFTSAEEKETIEQVIAFLETSGVFERPVVTQVEMLEGFYPAEEYHQNYYRKHGVSVC